MTLPLDMAGGKKIAELPAALLTAHLSTYTIQLYRGYHQFLCSAPELFFNLVVIKEQANSFQEAVWNRCENLETCRAKVRQKHSAVELLLRFFGENGGYSTKRCFSHFVREAKTTVFFEKTSGFGRGPKKRRVEKPQKPAEIGSASRERVDKPVTSAPAAVAAR